MLVSRRLLALSIGAAVVAGGCGGNPCTSISDPTGVWSQAALIHVDIYDDTARCGAGGVILGADPPLLALTFHTQGAISIDVPPGHRVIAMTLYSDVAATKVLASSCSEGEFQAGARACLDLTLSPATPDGGWDQGVDGSVALDCDAASDCPGADGGAQVACCDHLCVDTGGDVGNCGGCGLACSTENGAPVCAGGACSWSCASGFAHCQSGNTGCETDLAASGLRVCGSTCVPAQTCCNDTDCTAPPAPAACYAGTCPGAGGSCTYAIASGAVVCGATCCKSAGGSCNPDCTLACNAGAQNCDGQSANGCECAGTSCCAAGTCQTQHDDGVGQNFYDCVALGTVDVTQATEACAAFTGDASLCHSSTTCGGTGDGAVCSDGSSSACDCWLYTGANAGHVRINSVASCKCGSHPGMKPWT